MHTASSAKTKLEQKKSSTKRDPFGPPTFLQHSPRHLVSHTRAQSRPHNFTRLTNYTTTAAQVEILCNCLLLERAPAQVQIFFFGYILWQWNAALREKSKQKKRKREQNQLSYKKKI